jgi:hypothetical protein
MAKKKGPDITKFAGLDWEKISGCEPFVEEIEQCSFCGKGIKETDNYWQLSEIEGSSLNPFLFACAKCAISAGCEW